MRLLTPVDVRALPEPGEWEILAPVCWEIQWGRYVTIPAGFTTDFASVPKPLRAVLDVTGHSRAAAVLHDWLYCTQSVSRRYADELLRLALIACGMSAAAARVYWLGVRAGGWAPWNARLARGGGVQPDDFTRREVYEAHQ